MIPTEGEYTAASTAAAQKVYAAELARLTEEYPNEPARRSWEDTTPLIRRMWLEEVLPTVDAAISAIPDRLDPVRVLVDTVMTDAEFRNAVVTLVEK